MALLSFILFVEITVFRSANNIRLMQQIGYAPRALRQILIKYFLPWIGSAVCVAIILTAGINFLMIRWLASMDIEISFWTAWPVFALAIILVLLLGVLLTRAVRRTINNI
jgi:hypothetical protein